jgi:hypothetical protein
MDCWHGIWGSSPDFMGIPHDHTEGPAHRRLDHGSTQRACDQVLAKEWASAQPLRGWRLAIWPHMTVIKGARTSQGG